MLAPRPLSGRLLALFGLMFVALNLRTAVSALSPIIPFIRVSFELSTLWVGFLGMLPPLCFALGGLVAPLLTRKVGLEVALVILLATITLGHLVRTVSQEVSLLSFGTLIALLGVGVGNVLMPVVVRKYFPDRIGSMTALYLTLVSISSLAPPLIAVPVAEDLGWRFSLGQWALVSLLAIVPWLFELRRNRVEEDVVTQSLTIPPNVRHIKIWKSPTALAIVMIWSVASINGYAMFAWLPQILVDYALKTPLEAGILLSVFAGMGLPAALLMPRLATRYPNQAPIVYVGVGLFFVGYSGLIFFPTFATWLWVILIGLGPILFPLNLALFNLRTRSQQTLLRISGFAQGFGYLVASLGPLAIGILHEWSGSWVLSLWFMFLTAIPAIFAGIVISRQRFIDDELQEKS